MADLPKIAKELGMSAMAISDHGSLAGILEFYRECKKAGINPILGIEAYLTNDEDNLEKEKRTRDNYHVILLAKNLEGYKNLLWLSTNAYRNNYYYRPRISITQLANHSNGLIGNSACLAGVCSRSATYDEINHVYSDPEHKTERAIAQMKEIFHGDYNLEVMDNPFPQQEAYNKFLIEIGKKTNTKVLISGDAHYSKKEDYELHSMLMAMQTKQTLEEYNKGDFHYGPWYHIRSPEEMLAAAKRVGSEAAFYNTNDTASQCRLELELGSYKIPKFDIETDLDFQEYISGK